MSEAVNYSESDSENDSLGDSQFVSVLDYSAVLDYILPARLKRFLPLFASFLGQLRCDLCGERVGTPVRDMNGGWCRLCIPCFQVYLSSECS